MTNAADAVVDELWAIAEGAELVCWHRSRGVPFLTPSHELAMDTARSGDVLDPPRGGSTRTVVRVLMVHHQGMTLVINPDTMQPWCLLRPVDPGR